MNSRKLIVTHHSPDLDAVGAVWLLKRFDSQHYADAKIAFVNPGTSITLEEAEKYSCQLHEVIHVDTGLKEFDHHQEERAKDINVTATSLIYDYVCQIHPELKKDNTLKEIIGFINQIDHFREALWHEADSSNYIFMLHNLLEGHELVEYHDNDSLLNFGMKCLNYVYAVMEQHLNAKETIETSGQKFQVKDYQCLALKTANPVAMKLAQKMGYDLVVKKDPDEGYVRVHITPKCDLTLKKLAEKIEKEDSKGHWFYHGSGKMLLNGSSKDRKKRPPSPLTLEQVINFIKEIYG
jgi:hypothetical protein